MMNKNELNIISCFIFGTIQLELRTQSVWERNMTESRERFIFKLLDKSESMNITFLPSRTQRERESDGQCSV